MRSITEKFVDEPAMSVFTKHVAIKESSIKPQFVFFDRNQQWRNRSVTFLIGWHRPRGVANNDFPPRRIIRLRRQIVELASFYNYMIDPSGGLTGIVINERHNNNWVKNGRFIYASPRDIIGLNDCASEISMTTPAKYPSTLKFLLPFQNISLSIADFSHASGGVPERKGKPSYEPSGNCRNHDAVIFKQFSEMPEDDQRNVVRGALFLVGIGILAAYIVYDVTKR